MAEKRALRDDDVIHMHLASPTGAAVPMEVAIRLDQVAAYVMAKIRAAEPAAPAAPVAE